MKNELLSIRLPVAIVIAIDVYDIGYQSKKGTAPKNTTSNRLARSPL